MHKSSNSVTYEIINIPHNNLWSQTKSPYLCVEFLQIVGRRYRPLFVTFAPGGQRSRSVRIRIAEYWTTITNEFGFLLSKSLPISATTYHCSTHTTDWWPTSICDGCSHRCCHIQHYYSQRHLRSQSIRTYCRHAAASPNWPGYCLLRHADHRTAIL